MRVACIGYRSWALGIYDRLIGLDGHKFLILRSRDEFSEQVLDDFSPELVLFYGWSWIVPQSILERYTCVMLHPSELPLYRGGSPIQNQIIDGVANSKVTLFIMNGQIDAGDIIAQADLDLSLSLEKIFTQLEEVGLALTVKILNHGYKQVPQDNEKATYCKRRTPADSEITLDELKSKSSVYLLDKVRMLADPYPNAFIRTSDGRKLILKSVEIGD